MHKTASLGTRRARTWPWTLLACALVAITAPLTLCLLIPWHWGGPGRTGAVLSYLVPMLALSFPLHLLLVTAAAVVSWYAALRAGARLAAALSAVVAILTAAMGLVPAIATWQQARALGVPLSLRDYLANARHVNKGPAQPARSVVYGTAADGTRLVLDVWRSGRPGDGPLRPAIVQVHGGGWVRGNRSMTPDWNRWLNGLGYEVFDVEYRMPPNARWQDEVGDVKCALGWVAAHAADYHVDPARISIMGSSAGGNLAALAAYSAGDARLPPSCAARPVAVRSVVNLFGPADLARLHDAPATPPHIRAALRAYAGGTPAAQPQRYRLLSPLSHVGARTPPTITLIGLSDRVIASEQAGLLDDALARHGVPHETCLLRATDHAFAHHWGGFATQIARARIAAFLERHAGAAAPAAGDNH